MEAAISVKQIKKPTEISSIAEEVIVVNFLNSDNTAKTIYNPKRKKMEPRTIPTILFLIKS